MMKVFISHKNTDTALAANVAQQVRANGLEVYLDTIDQTLLKDGADLADYLLERMSQCHQLIAVVSGDTKTSWWVPWEIGVGAEKGFRMACYSESHVSLPSYLEKWPALHSNRHIDLYCQHSIQAEADVRQGVRGILKEEASTQVRKTEATNFHKSLIRALE